MVDHIDYSAFGQILNETNSSMGDRFKFTGREFDADTGLYYYRARYMDPRLGRFLTQDPLGGVSDVASRNLSVYAKNDPLLYVDPSGLIAAAEDSESSGSIQRAYFAAANKCTIVEFGVTYLPLRTNTFAPATFLSCEATAIELYLAHDGLSGVVALFDNVPIFAAIPAGFPPLPPA